jgi:hypothetical protein
MAGNPGEENPNDQIPNPNEIPKFNDQRSMKTTSVDPWAWAFPHWKLVIDPWDFIGIWDLNIGISPTGPSRPMPLAPFALPDPPPSPYIQRRITASEAVAYTGVYLSGQKGRTVNPLALPSQVRILPRPMSCAVLVLRRFLYHAVVRHRIWPLWTRTWPRTPAQTESRTMFWPAFEPSSNVGRTAIEAAVNPSPSPGFDAGQDVFFQISN